MKIKEIPPGIKYVLFYDDAYYQSSGYEREGEIGSRIDYINQMFFTNDEELKNWLIEHPQTGYKLYSLKNVNVKREVTFEIQS